LRGLRADTARGRVLPHQLRKARLDLLVAPAQRIVRRVRDRRCVLLVIVPIVCADLGREPFEFGFGLRLRQLGDRNFAGVSRAHGMRFILCVIPGRAAGASPESITPAGAVVYYVYILANRKHGTLYIGVTKDLVRRIYEHKTDAVCGFTSRYGVHLLVWFECYDDVLHAIAREKELKKWRREWKINL